MDADIFEVYKRLSANHFNPEYPNNVYLYAKHLKSIGKLNFPDLCTAEMTTFLKETTNGTAT